MNKLPIALGILVILLGIGYYFYSTSQSTTPEMEEEQVVVEEEEEEEEERLLSVAEILPFVGEDKDLRVFFKDLIAEFGGESPEKENFDAVYEITFEENSGRSIVLLGRVDKDVAAFMVWPAIAQFQSLRAYIQG